MHTWLCLGTSTRTPAATMRRAPIFQHAIARNPDNDQDYLSLALLNLREAISTEPSTSSSKGQRAHSRLGQARLGARPDFGSRRATRPKPPASLSAPSTCFPNGRAATPRSASSTSRPDKSTRREKFSPASRTAGAQQPRHRSHRAGPRSGVFSVAHAQSHSRQNEQGAVPPTGALSRRPNPMSAERNTDWPFAVRCCGAALACALIIAAAGPRTTDRLQAKPAQTPAPAPAAIHAMVH